MTIKRFHPISVGKMLGAIYAAMGLLIMVPALAIAIIAPAIGGASLADEPEMQAFSWVFGAMGFVLVLFVPVLYGFMGFIAGCISALLYNLFAHFAGGIRFDVDAGEPPSQSSVQTYPQSSPIAPA